MKTKITYDDFLEFAKKECSVRDEPRNYSYFRREKDRKVPEYIYNEWSTGGMSGGSCWDDDAPTAYVSNEKPPGFTDLETILTEFVPNLTYLQYRALEREVVEDDSYTQNEYYGNCTNYAMQKVELKKLYDYLVEQKWLK